MRRILLMVIRNILFVPVYWYKLCYHARHVEKYTEEEHYELLRYIDHRANTSGNINIKVYGQENIPDDNGFMFYPNHQGLYDVLAIMEACPRPFSVVAKKEVANVPFLKQVFACMKAYMIDREDVRQSLQVIINVSNDVKAGKNFLIFPEGTRSKKGNQVQEFKGGSFKAATRAKCPIVPVALVNCFVPFDSKTTEQVDVQVHFLKPLLYDEYKDMCKEDREWFKEIYLEDGEKVLPLLTSNGNFIHEGEEYYIIDDDDEIVESNLDKNTDYDRSVENIFETSAEAEETLKNRKNKEVAE